MYKWLKLILFLHSKKTLELIGKEIWFDGPFSNTLCCLMVLTTNLRYIMESTPNFIGTKSFCVVTNGSLLQMKLIKPKWKNEPIFYTNYLQCDINWCATCVALFVEKSFWSFSPKIFIELCAYKWSEICWSQTQHSWEG